MKITIYTGLALLAFAGNSVLCRLALGEETIDAASFTIIRLISGIVVLAIIIIFSQTGFKPSSKGSWKASSMLFLYAASFSFAYLSLDTGTGALILFGAVQITMIIYSVVAGARPHSVEWIGLIAAFLGFTYLLGPDLTTPSVKGFVLMSIAGIAWGFYTLNGKNSLQPLFDTAFNFFRTVPFLLVLAPFLFSSMQLSLKGVLLAVASGALASGLGYTIWYSALRGLSATQAAVLQLLVPVIAALGGTIFVNELISLRLIIASAVVLGGILLVIIGKSMSTSNEKHRVKS